MLRTACSTTMKRIQVQRKYTYHALWFAGCPINTLSVRSLGDQRSPRKQLTEVRCLYWKGKVASQVPADPLVHRILVYMLAPMLQLFTLAPATLLSISAT